MGHLPLIYHFAGFPNSAWLCCATFPGYCTWRMLFHTDRKREAHAHLTISLTQLLSASCEGVRTEVIIAESQTMRLPFLMASGKDETKAHHGGESLGHHTHQTAIASLFLPVQHLPSAVSLRREFQDYLVACWAVPHVGTDLTPALG